MKKKLIVAAGTVVLVLVIVLSCVLFWNSRREEQPPEITAVVVSNRLEQVSELATARYYYTNMGVFEDSNDFYGIKIPFTTKRFIVSYDGTILAGVDLAAADVVITDTALTVRLPEAAVLAHEIDEDSLEIYDETKNIFNPITLSDYNGFQADQKAAMEAKAVENGLLTQAKAQAVTITSQVLTPLADQYGLLLSVE